MGKNRVRRNRPNRSGLAGTRPGLPVSPSPDYDHAQLMGSLSEYIQRFRSAPPLPRGHADRMVKPTQDDFWWLDGSRPGLTVTVLKA